MGGNKTSLNPRVVEEYPDAYIPMGNTARERRAAVRREPGDQDAFALASHQKAAAAWGARRLRGRGRGRQDARLRR